MVGNTSGTRTLLHVLLSLGGNRVTLWENVADWNAAHMISRNHSHFALRWLDALPEIPTQLPRSPVLFLKLASLVSLEASEICRCNIPESDRFWRIS